MKVAIIHYWLLQMRGGEKVLENICELFPNATIYTHVLDKTKLSPFLQHMDIRTTFIHKLPFSKRLYKFYLPLMPFALEALDLSEYDLIISSESGPAKGIVPGDNSLHICYCHTPMRYLWGGYSSYFESSNFVQKFFMIFFFPFLRGWDVLTSKRVDFFLANSSCVSSRIKKRYGRESTIIFPPVDSAKINNLQKKEQSQLISFKAKSYYICLGALVPYKRVDLAVKACCESGRRLLIIGRGPELDKLKHMSGQNIQFIEEADDQLAISALANAKALIFPGVEDFGIVPLEAQACYVPVIAFRSGGVLDTVTSNTGVFFEEQTVDSLIAALNYFESNPHKFEDKNNFESNLSRFTRDNFKYTLTSFIKEKLHTN